MLIHPVPFRSDATGEGTARKSFWNAVPFSRRQRLRVAPQYTLVRRGRLADAADHLRSRACRRRNGGTHQSPDKLLLLTLAIVFSLRPWKGNTARLQPLARVHPARNRVGSARSKRRRRVTRFTHFRKGRGLVVPSHHRRPLPISGCRREPTESRHRPSSDSAPTVSSRSRRQQGSFLRTVAQFHFFTGPSQPVGTPPIACWAADTSSKSHFYSTS